MLAALLDLSPAHSREILSMMQKVPQHQGLEAAGAGRHIVAHNSELWLCTGAEYIVQV